MATRKTTRFPGWREMMRGLHPAVWQAAAQKQAREMACPTTVGLPLYAEAPAPAMAEAYRRMMCARRDWRRER
jgi:hypothetical protein